MSLEETASWPTVSGIPLLPVGEVHVWRAELDVDPAVREQLQQTLGPDELARAARYRFARHHDHFLMSHGILRAVLARYLQVAPRELCFAQGLHGKPALLGSAAGSLQFNLSRAHGLALYAVARGVRVGVDVEYVHADLAERAEVTQFFSPAEIRGLNRLSPTERNTAFFECWTRKEAFIKATGEGLTRALNSFTVSVSPGHADLEAVDDDPGEVSRWAMRAIAPAPGYQAALVVEMARPLVRCWHWQATAAQA